MVSFRSRNRGRKLLQAKMLNVCRTFFFIAAGCFLIAFEARPGGHLHGIHLLSFSGYSGKEGESQAPFFSQSQIGKSWVRSYSPFVLDAVNRARCKTSKLLQHKSPAVAQCSYLTNLANLDTATTKSPFSLIPARTARLFWAHLRSAAAFHILAWCPSFSATGWEISKYESYFRGLPPSVTGEFLKGISSTDVYCHLKKFKNIIPDAMTEPLSAEWWENAVCYESPVEHWISSWSNCSGVLKVRGAFRPGSGRSKSVLSEMHTANNACTQTCRMPSPKEVLSDKINHLRKYSNRDIHQIKRAQASELERIRLQLNAASVRNNWKKDCGYENGSWNVAFHVTDTKSLDFALNLIQTWTSTTYLESASKTVNYHIHLDVGTTEQIGYHLNSDPSTLLELRVSTMLNGEPYRLLGALPGSLPGLATHSINIISSYLIMEEQVAVWEPTRRIECLRSADALVLTQDSINTITFAPAVMGLHPVALPKSHLEESLLFKRVDKSKYGPTGNLARRHQTSLDLIAMALEAGGSKESSRWMGYDTTDDAYRSRMLEFLLFSLRPGPSNVPSNRECDGGAAVSLVGEGNMLGNVPRDGPGSPLLKFNPEALSKWAERSGLLHRRPLVRENEGGVFGASRVCTL